MVVRRNVKDFKKVGIKPYLLQMLFQSFANFIVEFYSEACMVCLQIIEKYITSVVISQKDLKYSQLLVFIITCYGNIALKYN